MKNTIILIFVTSFLLLFSCNRTTHLGRVVVGDDVDENGCKGSAGYQWSKLKKDCIRPFELPIQLTNKEKTFTAGVFISEDNLQAEVFTMDGVFILEKQSDDSYLSEKAEAIYYLKKVNNKWEFGNIKDTKASYKEF